MELVEIPTPDEWKSGLVVSWGNNKKLSVCCQKHKCLVNIVTGKVLEFVGTPTPSELAVNLKDAKFYRWEYDTN